MFSEKAELSLAFEMDDECSGRLTAAVQSGQFAGSGSAYFNVQHIMETFIVGLRNFPISSDQPPKLEGGFFQAGSLQQVHLRLAVDPHGMRGELRVRVDLATPSQRGADCDLQQSVTVRFLAEYSAVGAFASDLEQVLIGTRDRATLQGIVG